MLCDTMRQVNKKRGPFLEYCQERSVDTITEEKEALILIKKRILGKQTLPFRVILRRVTLRSLQKDRERLSGGAYDM